MSFLEVTEPLLETVSLMVICLIYERVILFNLQVNVEQGIVLVLMKMLLCFMLESLIPRKPSVKLLM